MSALARRVCINNPFGTVEKLLYLYYLNLHVLSHGFRESNGKQYCRLIQYVTGGHASPPLQVVFVNSMAHSGSVCAITVLFQQPHLSMSFTIGARGG